MPQAGLTQILDVVDGFYAAAQGERSWHLALDGLRIVLGGARACIAEATDSGMAVASHEAEDDPRFGEAELLGTYFRDPLAGVERAMPVGRPYSLPEIIDMADFTRRPLWGEFYDPMGLHDALSCRLAAGEGSMLVLHVTRHKRQARFGDHERRVLGHVLPHLMRAGALERSVGRGGDALARLEHSPASVFIIDGDCRVEWINTAGGEMLTMMAGPLSYDAGTRAIMPDMHRHAFRSLAAAICGEADVAVNGGTWLLETVPARGLAARHVLQVAPFADPQSFGVGHRRRAIVTLRSVSADANRLHVADGLEILGLTVAEARLATCLADGLTLRVAADRCGITFGTARNYLIRIFRKTGTDRQAALVELLRAVGRQ